MANGLIGKVTAGGGTHLIASTAYFTCETPAATAAKVAKAADTSLNSFTVITGMTIYVKFTENNGVANPTLTLQTNGGTELLAAKSIKRYGTTAPSTNAATSWQDGAVVALTYDGTNWIEVTAVDSNSTYSAMSVAEMRTGTATSSRSIRADYLKTFLSTLGGTALTLTHDATNGLILNHDNYVTAGTAGTSSATSGITLAVPYVTYNAQGHITATGTHTHTIPDASTSAKGVIQIGTGANNAAAGNHTHDDRYYTETEINTKLKKYVPSFTNYRNTNGNNNGKYYKIAINSYVGWMINFTVKLYHAYRAYDIQISGYNYGSNHWHLPKAVLLGTTQTDSIDVIFGYDSNYHLWVAIPAQQYTGMSICGVTNGYTEITDFEDLFTITMVDAEPTTKQTTITARKPLYTDEMGSLATKSTIADHSYTPAGTIALTNGNTTTTVSAASSGTATYTPGGSVSVSTNATTNKTATVSVASSGDATYTPSGTNSAPGFTGTAATLTHTFTGTAATIVVSGATATGSNITYTPAGTIQVSGTTSTATVVKTATFNTVVTSATVANEILTISTGAAGSSTNQTGVRTADPAYTFSGTGARLTASYTPAGSIGNHSYTPSGSVAAPVFTGTPVRLVTGNIAVPNTYTATFSGTAVRLVTGNISRPTSATFTGTPATLTHSVS